MHISLHYACLLICSKKARKKHGSKQSIDDQAKRNSLDDKKLHENKLKAALQQASEYGSLVKHQIIDVSEDINVEHKGTLERSRSLARLEAQKEFLKATSLAADTVFETEDSITDFNEAFAKFLTMYPKYKSSERIDELRVDEYGHLVDNDSKILNKKKRKKDSSKGLFVFPVQSRVTGAKYSYQWMSFAQQNNWHVLLDAGALGPLDMDSLGLSLFRPDFIITSFYRVFGFDPTGFGCLLIKKSMIKILKKQPGHTGSGMVKISPVYPSFYSDSTGGFPQFSRTECDDVVPESQSGSQLPVFSGVLTPSLVRDVNETEIEHGNYTYSDEGSPVFEEAGIFSIMKSPILSDDGSPEDSMWIDLGPSPLGSQPVMPLPPPSWFTRKRVSNIESQSQAHESMKANKVDYFQANICSPEIQEEPEIDNSVIRRDTEGEFRLQGRRVSFGFENIDDSISEEEQFESDRKEPKITCRHLDHVNMLGLSKTTSRLRFLINWLVTSLIQLRLPGSNTEDVVPLVHIYGPKIKYERGASVAFNIRDRSMGLISPEIVQKMAEANGISLGIGILSHIKIIQSTKQNRGAIDLADTTICRPMDNNVGGFVRAEVVTASLSFLTNFDDVYKLWVFVSKFLNSSFVREYGLSTVIEGEES
uniref:uncharacterized protein LOC122605286 isoform X2 n=1 Tax=Erigeron canadensis TaxID=72917 RepID=UPI001CB95F9E|nr:uncharacterized protein LOC122605286 isoform X2 [Erigeron canadensis]